MIFIDTGALLARHIVRDEHHATALAGFAQIDREQIPMATSIHVIDETITLLGRWAGPAFAGQRARAMLASRSLRVLRPSIDQEVEAIREFERFGDQGISFTDALSFVLMQHLDIREVFGFDHHFRLAGFSLWLPTRA